MNASAIQMQHPLFQTLIMFLNVFIKTTFWMGSQIKSNFRLSFLQFQVLKNFFQKINGLAMGDLPTMYRSPLWPRISPIAINRPDTCCLFQILKPLKTCIQNHSYGVEIKILLEYSYPFAITFSFRYGDTTISINRPRQVSLFRFAHLLWFKTWRRKTWNRNPHPQSFMTNSNSCAAKDMAKSRGRPSSTFFSKFLYFLFSPVLSFHVWYHTMYSGCLSMPYRASWGE